MPDDANISGWIDRVELRPIRKYQAKHFTQWPAQEETSPSYGRISDRALRLAIPYFRSRILNLSIS